MKLLCSAADKKLRKNTDDIDIDDSDIDDADVDDADTDDTETDRGAG